MAAMMSLSDHSLDAAQAENYFENHYSQDDYYTRNQRCVGRWIGRGAAGLGLAGEVSREDFSTLLQGRSPAYRRGARSRRCWQRQARGLGQRLQRAEIG